MLPTLRASAPEVPVGDVIEGMVKGVQPMVGAMNELIKALSEPFDRTREFLLAVVRFLFCINSTLAV